MAPGEELTCFTCCARSRQGSAARSWRAISAGRSIAFDLFILVFVMDDIADEFGGVCSSKRKSPTPQNWPSFTSRHWPVFTPPYSWFSFALAMAKSARKSPILANVMVWTPPTSRHRGAVAWSA
jgi:hypothetical protein